MHADLQNGNRSDLPTRKQLKPVLLIVFSEPGGYPRSSAAATGPKQEDLVGHQEAQYRALLPSLR